MGKKDSLMQPMPDMNKKKIVVRQYLVDANSDDPQAIECLRTHNGEFLPAALPITLSFAPAESRNIGRNGKVKL